MTFVPKGWQTVTPRIFVDDPKGLVEFIHHVFDATGEFQAARPTVVTIGDSMMMVSGTDFRPAMPAFLYVYVQDTDATYTRAVARGARVLEEPTATPYGDYRCMIEDMWGNTWQIATHKEAPRQ